MESNFYFIRHGYSCANLKKDKKRIFDQKFFQDPHLTNWGIIGSIIAGLELKKKLGYIKFNQYCCSPLLRTWETASCMLSSPIPKHILVAPYLREKLPNILGDIITTQNDNPRSYHHNLIKYNKFLKYISNLLDHWKELNKNKNSSSIKRIEKQLLNTKNIKISFNKKHYSSKYTNKGDISKFIEWYIDKFNTCKKQNVLVVSHGTIIRNYVKEYNKDLYNELKNPNNNNFVIKVSMIDKKLKNIDIIYKGINMPSSDLLVNVRSSCSMCNTFITLRNRNCKNKKKLKDKYVHDKLINNYFKI